MQSEYRKKLLYITDQQEYTEHGTIGPLFHGYLKDYVDINVVYLTKFKNSFQKKETDYVVPQQYTQEICRYLAVKDVDLASFDFIFVRNMLDVLADVLKHKKQYGYKVGFRVSFPKTEVAYEAQKALNSSSSFFRVISRYTQEFNKKRLLSQCDLFMPTSKEMQDEFYGNIEVASFPLPAGLDPKRITPHRASEGNERHFIYVGTLDSLREFDKVLLAFSKLASKEWHLNISTLNTDFAKQVMQNYPKIIHKVTILHAENLDELMKQVDDCDVGIALLPDIPIYSTSIPAKVMDYYTCALPAMLTDNSKNRALFDDEDALFCRFDIDSIATKLEEIIAMSQDDIAKMGHAGQVKLLQHKRNYEIMAKELYERLKSL